MATKVEFKTENGALVATVEEIDDIEYVVISAPYAFEDALYKVNIAEAGDIGALLTAIAKAYGK